MLVNELPATQLYLVQRQGPMSFVLCEDGADTQHKVLLGSQPTCSCRHEVTACKATSVHLQRNCKSACRKSRGIELCIHHVFVMLRILRLSASNPLIWQLSLIGNTSLHNHLSCPRFLLLAHIPAMHFASSQDQQLERSCIADRELDEALWQSGTHQIIAAQHGHANTMPDAAAAAAPVKRRPLEQVGIKLSVHVHACRCADLQASLDPRLSHMCHFATSSRGHHMFGISIVCGQ